MVAKSTFSHIDAQVFRALMAWIKRRHPNKSESWKRKRYFRRDGLRHWVFCTPIRDKSGAITTLDLFRVASVPIVRHVKIQAKATPYDPAYTVYFARRAQARRAGRQSRTGMFADTQAYQDSPLCRVAGSL